MLRYHYLIRMHRGGCGLVGKTRTHDYAILSRLSVSMTLAASKPRYLQKDQGNETGLQTP